MVAVHEQNEIQFLDCVHLLEVVFDFPNDEQIEIQTSVVTLFHMQIYVLA